MKKIFIALMFFGVFTPCALTAQDIVVLKNGDEIKAKIIEIGTDVVKYKKWENVDGPLYSTEKQKIFMVKYQNGTKDIFSESSSTPKPKVTDQEEPKKTVTESVTNKPIKNRPIRFERLFFGGGRFYYGDDNSLIRFKDVGNVMSKVPNAYAEFSKAKNKETWALVMGVLGGVGIGIGLASEDEEAAVAPLLGGLLVATGGTILQFSAMKSYENAAFNYSNASITEGVSKPKKIQLGLGVTKRGLGVVCKF